MKVKKYQGDTMQQALAEVKKDLGTNAVILHTKTKKTDGIFGLWGKEMVEITASRDVNIVERPKQKAKGNILSYYAKMNLPSQEQPKKNNAQHVDMKGLHSDLHEVKSLVMSLVNRSKCQEMDFLNDELIEAYLMLIEQEVSEELSKEIIQKIKDEIGDDDASNREVIHEALMQKIKDMLPPAEPILFETTGKAKKVALVGPTGVGKTTTIAKLAADFALRHKKDVALITIDTYRIAAVQQLRTYADIINIPLEVVLTPHEIRQALHKHKHRDLILIDTAGRSQKNALQMSELRNFLEVIKPDETHLVLATTTNSKHVRDVIERFTSFSIDKLIFTKLDEAVSFGLILDVMNKLNKRLSYITTGQNVPDDIEITNPHKIAQLIVRGES